MTTRRTLVTAAAPIVLGLAVVSTWAQNLAPTLAAELRPYLAEIIRESR